MPQVRFGLDVAVDWLRGRSAPPAARETVRLLRTGRLGLVTNPSAVTTDLIPAPDALQRAGAKLAALYGPEHGIRGEIPDGVRVPHGKDAVTGLPAWSLYGETVAPTREMLKGVDAILFDIQDVGARFYTFSSTLAHVMRGAKAAGLPVIILDRPNPLGGRAVEGPLLEPAHASFVGLHPIPIRHGATLAELGHLWSEFGDGAPPLSVPCEHWRTEMRWDQTGLPFVPPSPNMPSAETALLYPGTCLLEGTNVSEGRGTACPFRWFGAPWVNAEKLAAYLNGRKLPGVRFRPTRFRPTASKFVGETCAGCQIHVGDAAQLRPVATGVAVLGALHELFPRSFAWRRNGERFAVDRLAGASWVREAVDQARPWQEIAARWEAGEATHRARLTRLRVTTPRA